jgi:small subunit ribosomal protein S16
MGAKKLPFYRIVVADQQASRNGGFIENIGTYDPISDPEKVTLATDRADYWLSVGAQPSEAVARLLRNANLLDAAGKRISAAPADETPVNA